MILITTLTIIYAYIYAEIDAKIINSGTWIRGKGHSIRFLIRAGVIIFYTLILLDAHWVNLFSMIMFQGTVFWIVFDHALNILRKKPFWYVGRTAFLDRLFGEQIHLFKLIMLIIWAGAYYNL